jgi:hypothetical protein
VALAQHDGARQEAPGEGRRPAAAGAQAVERVDASSDPGDGDAELAVVEVVGDDGTFGDPVGWSDRPENSR